MAEATGEAVKHFKRNWKNVATRLGDYGTAVDHLDRAVSLFESEAVRYAVTKAEDARENLLLWQVNSWVHRENAMVVTPAAQPGPPGR